VTHPDGGEGVTGVSQKLAQIDQRPHPDDGEEIKVSHKKWHKSVDKRISMVVKE